MPTALSDLRKWAHPFLHPISRGTILTTNPISLSRWCSLVLWPYWIPLFLFLGVVVRFRLYSQNHAFWYDEAYLLLNVIKRSYADLIGAADYNLVVPVGYLWIERAIYQATGGREWAMRLPALLAGLAALILMVPLAKRVIGGWAAWLAVALLATSRHALSHGCEVRTYTIDLLVAIVILMCTAVLVDKLSTRRSRRFAAASLLITTAI